MQGFDCDVVIAGAGPAGCMTAIQLGGKRFRVKLLEEHPRAGTPANCTGVVGVDAFKEFGLPENSILRRTKKVKLVSPSGEEFCLDRGKVLAYTLDRSLFDSELAEMAVAGGAELLCGAKVRGIEQDSKGVTVKAEQGSRHIVLRSRACVVATGAFSNLPSRMGMGRFKRVVRTAQVNLDSENFDPAGVTVYPSKRVAGGGFIWVVPAQGKTVRVGIMTRDHPVDRLKVFLKQGDLLRGHEESGLDVKAGMIGMGIPRRVYSGRIVSVGGAAAHVKPVSGGGIYFSLLSARILSGVMADLLRKDDFRPGSFSGYSKLVDEKIGAEIKMGFYFRSIFERLGDEDWDGIISSCGKFSGQVTGKSDFDRHSTILKWFLTQPVFREILFRNLKSGLRKLGRELLKHAAFRTNRA